MSVRSEILDQIKQVAHEQDKRLGPLCDELQLLDSGLDSLCFAILVSRLEVVLGVDPFSESTDTPFPVNLGEFIRFYENARISDQSSVISDQSTVVAQLDCGVRSADCGFPNNSQSAIRSPQSMGAA